MIKQLIVPVPFYNRGVVVIHLIGNKTCITIDASRLSAHRCPTACSWCPFNLFHPSPLPEPTTHSYDYYSLGSHLRCLCTLHHYAIRVLVQTNFKSSVPQHGCWQGGGQQWSTPYESHKLTQWNSTPDDTKSSSASSGFKAIWLDFALHTPFFVLDFPNITSGLYSMYCCSSLQCVSQTHVKVSHAFQWWW